jgi:4-hydroxy-2-oxoheptanedioate aldolase
MTFAPNSFKHALRGTKPLIGLWTGLTDPVAVEITAGAGFDWVVLDCEHAPNDLRSVLTSLQVLAAYPTTHPIVRVPIGDPTILKRVLDIGAQTIVVPMVETAEQAANLVRYTRYPPAGIRGIGTALARAARWNRTSDYLARANDEIYLIVQVETRRGLDNLDAIAATPGVDSVFIGPADLAAALGHIANSTHPEVQAAINDAFKRIHAANKATGFLTGDDKIIEDCLAAGVRYIAVGTDTGLLASATRALAERWVRP